MTIGKLKAVFMSHAGTPPASHQILFYNGIPMKDEWTLASYGFRGGCTAFMTSRKNEETTPTCMRNN